MEPLRILLVEDSTTQARFLEQTLRAMDPPPSEVAWVDDLAHAVGRPGDSMDLVLLDLVLPDSAGIETFRAVQAAHPRLPIIVLSGTGDERLAHQAVAEGAQDYLFKSTVSPDALARSIRFAIERHRTLDQLRQAAMYDALTGIYNRRGFTALAERRLALARRSGAAITVLVVDVDGLKEVNDTYGHEDGDLLLGDLARLMTTTFRASDVIGRVGGDEFCALVAAEDADGTTPAAATRLRQAVDHHNGTAHRRFHLSCSIGMLCLHPTAGSTLADLLAQADAAMYTEKRETRASRPSDDLPRPAPGLPGSDRLVAG